MQMVRMTLTTVRYSVCLIDEDVSDPRLGAYRDARGPALTSRKEAERKLNRRRSEWDMTRQGCQ